MLVKGERSHMAVSFFINDFLKTNIPPNAGKSESPNLQSFMKQQFPGTLDQQKGNIISICDVLIEIQMRLLLTCMLTFLSTF